MPDDPISNHRPSEWGEGLFHKDGSIRGIVWFTFTKGPAAMPKFSYVSSISYLGITI